MGDAVAADGTGWGRVEAEGGDDGCEGADDGDSIASTLSPAAIRGATTPPSAERLLFIAPVDAAASGTALDLDEEMGIEFKVNDPVSEAIASKRAEGELTRKLTESTWKPHCSPAQCCTLLSATGHSCGARETRKQIGGQFRQEWEAHGAWLPLTCALALSQLTPPAVYTRTRCTTAATPAIGPAWLVVR